MWKYGNVIIFFYLNLYQSCWISWCSISRRWNVGNYHFTHCFIFDCQWEMVVPSIFLLCYSCLYVEDYKKIKGTYQVLLECSVDIFVVILCFTFCFTFLFCRFVFLDHAIHVCATVVDEVQMVGTPHTRWYFYLITSAGKGVPSLCSF